MNDRKTNDIAAAVVSGADEENLKGFLFCNATISKGAKIYTDEHRSYIGLPNHNTVKHKRRQYVHGDVHINGNRIVLGSPSAGVLRNLPVDQLQAPSAVRERVCGQTQHTSHSTPSSR